jgi:hypothetical protein
MHGKWIDTPTEEMPVDSGRYELRMIKAVVFGVAL